AGSNSYETIASPILTPTKTMMLQILTGSQNDMEDIHNKCH
ncbi:19022_t:CDS:1, partial [Cetraspora pellucida]